jgi:hypothetical protein
MKTETQRIDSGTIKRLSGSEIVPSITHWVRTANYGGNTRIHIPAVGSTEDSPAPLCQSHKRSGPEREFRGVSLDVYPPAFIGSRLCKSCQKIADVDEGSD